MKIIITTNSPALDGELNPRFGRAAYFLVIDTDSLEWQAVPNPALGARGGAGIQAAQFASDQGCQAVISGDFGPNAYDALKTAGITMYLFNACRTPEEAIQRFKDEQLEALEAPSEGGGRGRRSSW